MPIPPDADGPALAHGSPPEMPQADEPGAFPAAGKPRTRGDCESVARPCPWEACRYHLEAGAESCALDVAERGPLRLWEVAELVGGGDREAMAKIEARALLVVRRRLKVLGFAFDHFTPTPEPIAIAVHEPEGR